eukprot:g27030.t1
MFIQSAPRKRMTQLKHNFNMKHVTFLLLPRGVLMNHNPIWVKISKNQGIRAVPHAIIHFVGLTLTNFPTQNLVSVAKVARTKSWEKKVVFLPKRLAFITYKEFLKQNRVRPRYGHSLQIVLRLIVSSLVKNRLASLQFSVHM